MERLLHALLLLFHHVFKLKIIHILCDFLVAPGTGGSREASNGQGVGTDKESGKRGGGRGSGSGASNIGEGSLAQRKVGLDSFKIVRVIGKGSFGKVHVFLGCTSKIKGTCSSSTFFYWEINPFKTRSDFYILNLI